MKRHFKNLGIVFKRKKWENATLWGSILTLGSHFIKSTKPLPGCFFHLWFWLTMTKLKLICTNLPIRLLRCLDVINSNQNQTYNSNGFIGKRILGEIATVSLCTKTSVLTSAHMLQNYYPQQYASKKMLQVDSFDSFD